MNSIGASAGRARRSKIVAPGRPLGCSRRGGGARSILRRMLCRPTAGIRRLLEMQADPGQDQRPERHGKHRREHGLEGGQMREVVVRVRDEHTNDQIDDDENVAKHAALLEMGPRSRVEPESLRLASAIRQIDDARRLPFPSASPQRAAAGAHERFVDLPPSSGPLRACSACKSD